MELRKESSRNDNKVTINAKSIRFHDLTFFSLDTIDLGRLIIQRKKTSFEYWRSKYSTRSMKRILDWQTIQINK